MHHFIRYCHEYYETIWCYCIILSINAINIMNIFHVAATFYSLLPLILWNCFILLQHFTYYCYEYYEYILCRYMISSSTFMNINKSLHIVAYYVTTQIVIIKYWNIKRKNGLENDCNMLEKKKMNKWMNEWMNWMWRKNKWINE